MRNGPLSERCKTTYRLAGLLLRFPQLSTLSYKRHTEGYLLLAYLACRALTSAS